MPGIADPIPGERPIENIFWASMRARCLEYAKDILADNNFEDDEWGVLRTAKAVGVAIEKASVELSKYKHGVKTWPASQTAPAGPSTHSEVVSLESNADVKGDVEIALSKLIEGWWAESKLAGRKPTTYESYRNTFTNFIQFLSHDDAALVTKKDVIAFKDYRLTTPSRRSRRIPSAKTIKDSDLSGLKAVFDWAVTNDRMQFNPATGVTIKLGKPARHRSKGFTDDEAR